MKRRLENFLKLQRRVENYDRVKRISGRCVPALDWIAQRIAQERQRQPKMEFYLTGREHENLDGFLREIYPKSHTDGTEFPTTPTDASLYAALRNIMRKVEGVRSVPLANLVGEARKLAPRTKELQLLTGIGKGNVLRSTGPRSATTDPRFTFLYAFDSPKGFIYGSERFTEGQHASLQPRPYLPGMEPAETLPDIGRLEALLGEHNASFAHMVALERVAVRIGRYEGSAYVI
jgi:hypothetical protein